MAKSIKLPNIKVRKRSTRGKSKLKSMSRGSMSLEQFSTANKIKISPDHGINYDDYCDEWDPFDSMDCEPQNELPNLYTIKQKIATDAWHAIREQLRNVCVESYVLPDNQLCISCATVDAKMWCRRCGHNAFFCPECWESSHETMNIFHTPEVWEDGCFRPVVMPNHRVNSLPNHFCETKRDVVMKCLDEDGITHGILFATCECEKIAVTLARSRLWPSTPKNPRFAFSFELLDWYESLAVECQVSLKDFCEALHYKCPHLVVKQRDVYESLIDSFEEFRFMKSQLRHMKFLCPELDDGNVCPACPKEKGTAIVSMDALFGLPRKRSAGTSHRNPLYNNLYFLQQNEVDEFIQQQRNEPAENNECNAFMAGDPIRSSTRYHGLDETAVFGCACRHEIPLMFISLKHGERLGYAIYILKKVLSYYPETIQLVMMYDIACTLQRHLKAHNTLSPISNSRVQFSIPIFHAYGHKAECQLTLSPLRCSGLGLSDGEVMERLWSFLRRFSRMTKEMRPSHRIDVLSSALNYYAYKKKLKLHETLIKRHEKAHKKKLTALETFQSLSTQYQLSSDDIEHLVDEPSISSIPTHVHTWKNAYCLELLSYYKLSDELSAITGVSVERRLNNKIERVLKKLEMMEKKHDISSRWEKDSDLYLENVKYHLNNRSNEFKRQLRLTTERRHFLLRQKAKYADGQKIAKKLSKQITKITTSIRAILSQYNNLCIQTNETKLALPDVLNVNSQIWSSELSVADSHIPADAQHDILQSFFELNRCEEELNLVAEEMTSTISYYKDKISCINSTLLSLNSSEASAFNKGSIVLLTRLKWSMELLMHNAESSELKGNVEEESSEDSEISDIDSDYNEFVNDY